jgi:hypothetical protein
MTKWTDHVKSWAAANNKSYGCAISDPRCKASYRSGATVTGKKEVQNELIEKYPAYAEYKKKKNMRVGNILTAAETKALKSLKASELKKR